MENKYSKSGREIISLSNLDNDWDNDLDNSGLLEEDEVDDDILEEENENNY